MELANGRVIFERYGRYESDPHAIAAMPENAVPDVQTRAALRGESVAGESVRLHDTCRHAGRDA